MYLEGSEYKLQPTYSVYNIENTMKLYDINRQFQGLNITKTTRESCEVTQLSLFVVSFYF